MVVGWRRRPWVGCKTRRLVSLSSSSEEARAAALSVGGTGEGGERVEEDTVELRGGEKGGERRNKEIEVEDDEEVVLQRLLWERFDHREFRPGQKDVMKSLLRGQSAAAVFPTGSGKSLCYQLPALALEGVTLVVSPLLALMKDQVDFLRGRNIPAEMITSKQTPEEIQRVYDDLQRGSVKILFCSPERFKDRRFVHHMERIPIAIFTVDEAHCVSEWGNNFRPDFLHLATMSRRLQSQRTLALTATATKRVLSDIQHYFNIDPTNSFRTSFFRPNLHLRVSTPLDPLWHLRDQIQNQPPGSTIVYATTQQTTESIAVFLRLHDIDAEHYHAGMSSEDRDRIQDHFMNDRVLVIVATIAFGMGIDKSDIRYIYHFNVAKSIEGYSQEIGRAGRDGRVSICETFYNKGDIITVKNLVQSNVPSLVGTRAMLSEFFGPSVQVGDVIRMRLYQFRKLFDISSTVGSLITSQLIQTNILRELPTSYSTISVKDLRTAATATASPPPLSTRLEDLLYNVRGMKKKATTRAIRIDVEKSMEAGIDEEEILLCLNELTARKDFEVKTSGRVTRFELLQPIDAKEYAWKAYNKLATYAQGEVERMEALCALLSSKKCHTKQLAAHFDDYSVQDDCGHCQACINTS